MSRTAKSKRPTTEREIAVAIGQALRDTREEQSYNQSAVAEVLGIHQATVSSIELGTRCAEHWELSVLEDWWELPRGYIQRRADVIDLPIGVVQTIKADPRLTREAAEMLVVAYEAAVKAKPPRRRRT